MSTQDPTTIKNQARDISAASGKVYWRSIDELVGTTQFREFLHREFQPYASELLDGTRRNFLKIMGASIALAGAATIPGCRRPDHKILSYQRQPESVVVGKPTYYATAMPGRGGGCEGLLAETYEGRPIKLDGNPMHPVNLGKSGLHSQAEVLSLYDLDRDPAVTRRIVEKMDVPVDVMSWADFETYARDTLPGQVAADGAGVAFLVGKSTSPSRDRMRDALQAQGKWSKSQWYAYEPVEDDAAVAGARMVFGAAYRPALDLARARVVVSLDRDFLGSGDPDFLANSRGFSAGRYRTGSDDHHPAAGSSMSRLYAVESNLTLTGGAADHRLRLKPSHVEAAAIMLALAIAEKSGGANANMVRGLRDARSRLDGIAIDQAWIDAAADDLIAAGGACAVLCGPNLRPEIHAMVCGVNELLGATREGNPVRYAPVSDEVAGSSAASIKRLVTQMNAGNISTVIVVGCNPVYDAPADLEFAEAYAKVGTRIHVGEPNETAFASSIHLEKAHFLESWSDVLAWDGTYSVCQPMIKPLFDRRCELEFLAILAGHSTHDPYEIVRSTMQRRMGGASGDRFEGAWRRTLHNGRVDQDGGALARPAVRSWATIGEVAASVVMNLTAESGIEVVFTPCPKVLDGRYSNNGWLQELPHPVTKVSWDNPALISKATADRLGISANRHPRSPQYNHARWIRVKAGGREVEVPVLVMPGVADDTVVLTLGYGRTRCGRVGDAVGIDVNPLRTTNSMRVARNAEVEKVSRRAYLLANTQDHWTMESRAIVREVDLAAWQKYGDEIYKGKDPYDETRHMNFAGRLGEEGHTPENRDIYSQQQQTPHVYYERDEHGKPLRDEHGHIIGRQKKVGDRTARVQQWGMSIDLTRCSGCGACTVACQSENNIPIVGKMEVAKGREMHWIRVDRYFSSNLSAAQISESDPRREEHEAAEDSPWVDADVEMVVMPVACVHCESAPCEVVCPVNATVHGREGTNDMTYNRCIGTRYCSNNCPYKVRRFNYFDYGTKQYKGGFGQLAEAVPDTLAPSNQNFIPPRLREPISDVAQMKYNPHVTVRSRGVMEKCTYCIQRINQARVETKLKDLPIIPDGYFETACQQACPTDAIVFGDIYDPESRVSATRFEDGRSYQLLAFLNTRPRTTYNVRLRNPNPTLRTPIDTPWVDHDHHSGDGHDDHHDGHDTDHHDEHAKGRLMSLPVLNNGGVSA